MSATASELAERAQDVVERLSAAIQAGASAAHLQLICSDLFEALRLEFNRTSRDDRALKELLSAALDLCKRSSDPTLTAQLRLAQLRAIVAIFSGEAPSAQQPMASRSRFQVIQGGLA